MRAFLTNLGKYNEGELVGKWIDLPISEYKFEEELASIGIDGEEYEEYFFTDYDCDAVYIRLGEYENIELLNEIAEKLESAIMCAVYEVFGIYDMLNSDEDDWILLEDVESDYDLGYYWAEESGCYDLESMGTLARYIDYESFGRDIHLENGGGYSNYGYIEQA